MPNMDQIDHALTFVTDHPEQHIQAEWICGTGGCLAGWGAMLNGYVQVPKSRAEVVPADKEKALLKAYARYQERVEAWRLKTDKFGANYGEYEHAARLWERSCKRLGVRKVRAVAMELFGIDAATANVLFAATNTLDKLQLMGKDIANGDALWNKWVLVPGKGMKDYYEQVQL
jgi:hypothetical protein